MRRFAAVFLIMLWLSCFAVVSVSAASRSDLWWNPSESGWGVNVAEQEGTSS